VEQKQCWISSRNEFWLPWQLMKPP